MQLVERHIISRNHHLFKEIDALAFLSKNLYNAALYSIRQEYIHNKKYLNKYEINKLFKNSDNPDYTALPRKVSQHVIFQVDQNFRAFFESLKAFRLEPGRFRGIPKIPYYKEKNGRNLLIYTNQAFSSKLLKKGILKLSGTNIEVSTKQTFKSINQVQISPGTNCYIISVIYTVPDIKQKEQGNTAAIDIGLNNLAALTYSNKKQPLLLNGRPLKSINQYYNKTKAELQSQLTGGKKSSNRIDQLTLKRNNKIADYLHKSSRYIINQLVSNDVSLLIVGYNPTWKQEINIGKKNNQNFVSVPFATFIHQLKYKSELVGIKVVVREESYTSKCSFLDLESIQKQEQYKGSRIKRGLFRSSTGKLINADINGSYNIMRKEAPKIFDKGVEGVVVHPLKVAISL